MKIITEINEIKHNIDTKDLCLLFFSSSACNPCKAVKIKIETLETEYKTLSTFEVNLDNNGEVQGHYLVFTFPTLILFHKGKEVYKSSRFIVMEEFIQKLAFFDALIKDEGSY